MDEENEKKELCTIRVMFKVDSDAQAIEVKQKMADALSDYPEAQFNFSIITMPKK